MKRYCYEHEHIMFQEAFRAFLQQEVVPFRDEWR